MAAGRETDEHLTEYEKQRLVRIRENEARLEALGLRSLAASPLLRSPSPGTAKGKQKKRSADEDEEYVPSDSGGGEDEDGSSSESSQDEEVEGEGKSASRSRAKGKKKKLSKSGKSTKSTPTKGRASFADVVDDDTALQQAIALSLTEYSEISTAMGAETSSTVTGASECTPHKNNNKASVQDSAKNKKMKKLGKSRIQLTEDDVVAFFFSFDEVGKGYITPWDLERMATINDFIWTDSEISKMIHCFDSDGDGKVCLPCPLKFKYQCFIWNPLEKVEPVWFMRFAKHSLAPENETVLTVLFPHFYLPHQSKLIVRKHPGSP